MEPPAALLTDRFVRNLADLYASKTKPKNRDVRMILRDFQKDLREFVTDSREFARVTRKIFVELDDIQESEETVWLERIRCFMKECCRIAYTEPELFYDGHGLPKSVVRRLSQAGKLKNGNKHEIARDRFRDTIDMKLKDDDQRRGYTVSSPLQADTPLDKRDEYESKQNRKEGQEKEEEKTDDKAETSDFIRKKAVSDDYDTVFEKEGDKEEGKKELRGGVNDVEHEEREHLSSSSGDTRDDETKQDGSYGLRREQEREEKEGGDRDMSNTTERVCEHEDLPAPFSSTHAIIPSSSCATSVKAVGDCSETNKPDVEGRSAESSSTHNSCDDDNGNTEYDADEDAEKEEENDQEKNSSPFPNDIMRVYVSEPLGKRFPPAAVPSHGHQGGGGESYRNDNRSSARTKNSLDASQVNDPNNTLTVRVTRSGKQGEEEQEEEGEEGEQGEEEDAAEEDGSSFTTDNNDDDKSVQEGQDQGEEEFDVIEYLKKGAAEDDGNALFFDKNETGEKERAKQKRKASRGHCGKKKMIDTFF